MVAFSHYRVSSMPEGNPRSQSSPGLVQCLRHIVKTEGTKALFKGLGPNIVGVAPSRAIYFCTYSQTKVFFNGILPSDSPLVHVCSAFCAGNLYNDAQCNKTKFSSSSGSGSSNSESLRKVGD